MTGAPDNVTKLQPHLTVVGSDYRFDPDEILEEAKGNEFKCLVVIGELPNGKLYVASNANAGMAVILLELAKYQLVHDKQVEL